MTRVLFLTTNDDIVNDGDPLSASSIIDRHHNSNDNNNNDDEEDCDGDDGIDGLNIAIVGTGPSGLLLAHLLLQERKGNGHQITLFDGRSDPRSSSATNQGRAYALGLGIRGRTAIRSVDESVWQTIKGRGYESERFRVHVTLPFLQKDVVIPLRSEPKEQEDTAAAAAVVEPSLLIYQSELCAGLLDELERRHLTSSVATTTTATTQLSSSSQKQQQQQKQRLDIHFNTKILDCDFESMTLSTTQHKHKHKHDDAATTTNDNNSSSDAIKTTRTTTPAANMNTTTNTNTATSSMFGPFDLIVGCDGVNSQVRNSMQDSFGPAFQTSKAQLPGLFKVARLNDAINRNVYDPTAVSLLLPSGAFIEPTSQDGSCCILFSGKDDKESGSDSGTSSGDNNNNNNHLPIYLTDTTNKTAIIDSLSKTFPQWRTDCYDDIAKQLIRTTTRTATTATTTNSTTSSTSTAASSSSSSSYTVTCNTYHYQDKAVLVGDAAHATGGVSGQGVNSALVDAVVLADCIQQQQQQQQQAHNITTGTLTLHEALLEYSIRQVPEGQALYDLSFCPQPQGVLSKVRWILKNILDAVFRGRVTVFGIQVGEMPLQTRLSSELTPFVTIRREREEFYSGTTTTSTSTTTSTNTNNNLSSSFPSDSEFREQLSMLHNTSEATPVVEKERYDIR